MNNFSYSTLSHEELRCLTVLETLNRELEANPGSLGDIKIDLSAKESTNN